MNNFSPLEQLAQHYGTDKLKHGYIPYYEKYLPKYLNSLLEIGIAEGGSAMMWGNYYDNNKIDFDLHILDLFINPDFVDENWCDELNIVAWKGDQSDIGFLKTITEKFDVIIDDGSHRADHMLITFKQMFLNNTHSDSIYVIEDLHCCEEEFFRGEVKSYLDTALVMFKNFQETGYLVNPYFSMQETEMFEKMIEWVKVFDDKIVFIKRK